MDGCVCGLTDGEMEEQIQEWVNNVYNLTRSVALHVCACLSVLVCK